MTPARAVVSVPKSSRLGGGYVGEGQCVRVQSMMSVSLSHRLVVVAPAPAARQHASLAANGMYKAALFLLRVCCWDWRAGDDGRCCGGGRQGLPRAGLRYKHATAAAALS